MLQLLGDKAEDATAEAATILRIETNLAKGQMTRVERRDPPKLYHKMSVDDLKRLAPAFEWNAYFSKIDLGSLQTLNVIAPDYFHVMSDEIAKESLADWQTYLRWHAAHDAAHGPVLRIRKREFQFLWQDAPRARGVEPALEALHERCGQ